VNAELLTPWADQRTPALAIVARGDQIRSISPIRYEVRSQSRPERKYEISIRRDHWSCSCAFQRSTRRTCIHILAIRYHAKLGDSPDDGAPAPQCPQCGSSQVIRFGRRHNRSGTVNRYLCKACDSRFTNREGALRLRYDPRTVALALDLYFRGLSLRKVSDHLKQAYGLSVAPMTIYGWIARFTPRAARWMDSLGARTGEKWHVDETVVTSDGNPRWVWNVVDAQTRFLIATHATKLRRVRDARVLMRRAKATTPDRPLTVLSDGLPAYRKAVGRELSFRCDGEVVNPHHRVPSVRAKKSNNLVERLHGTEKDRIKVMRGFHGRKGPKLLMEGFRVHYNIVRPHGALGTTPGIAASLPDPGGFRWREILRQATNRIPSAQAEIVFVIE
jgi:putative transposase